jgi:hypothetical protein
MAQTNMPEDSMTVDLAQDVPPPQAPPGSRFARNPRLVTGSAIICLLVVAVYYQVLVKLIADWWNIPDYSHGFLVPLFALYLIWEKRAKLLATTIAPVWSGVGVMALALVVLLLGVYGSELFLSRISLVILLAGLVLCFGGHQLLRELRFVLLVLVLAIPLPSIITTRSPSHYRFSLRRSQATCCRSSMYPCCVRETSSSFR